MASGTSSAIARSAERRLGSECDLQDRPAPAHQRPGQGHGLLRHLYGEHRDDRRPGGDGGNVSHAHCQTLQPPSITLTVPVVKADSSLAR